MTLMDTLIQNAKDEKFKNTIWIDQEDDILEKQFLSEEETLEIYNSLQDLFSSMENNFPEYLKKVNYDNIRKAELCRNKYMG